MANTMTDLNAHLFAQLERLDVEQLSPEQIKAEAERADAIVKVSDQIIANASLQLKAAKMFAEHGSSVLPMLPKLGEEKA